MRDDRWSESIAVGSLTFIEKVKSELGSRATHRDVVEAEGTYALRESVEAYGFKFAGENEALRSQIGRAALIKARTKVVHKERETHQPSLYDLIASTRRPRALAA